MDGFSIHRLVRDDVFAREQLGVSRYGTTLQPHNGRDALVDAYQEILDLACYLRQYMAEQGIDPNQIVDQPAPTGKAFGLNVYVPPEHRAVRELTEDEKYAVLRHENPPESTP